MCNSGTWTTARYRWSAELSTYFGSPQSRCRSFPLWSGLVGPKSDIFGDDSEYFIVLAICLLLMFFLASSSSFWWCFGCCSKALTPVGLSSIPWPWSSRAPSWYRILGSGPWSLNMWKSNICWLHLNDLGSAYAQIGHLYNWNRACC